MRLYKFLNPHGTSPYRGVPWPLPDGETPGGWVEATGPLETSCGNGVHVLRADQLLEWLCGDALWEVEADPEQREDAEKHEIITRRARLLARVPGWNERTCRLFACDCAEHVLPTFERARPGDERPRKAIAVARRFADGLATKAELAATWAATRDAAGAAARDAARDAARAAAWAAECRWQTERLCALLNIPLPEVEAAR